MVHELILQSTKNKIKKKKDVLFQFNLGIFVVILYLQQVFHL